MSKSFSPYSFFFFHRDKLGSSMHIYVNYLYYIRRANKPNPSVSRELLRDTRAVTILDYSLELFPRIKVGRHLPPSPEILVHVFSHPLFSFSLAYSKCCAFLLNMSHLNCQKPNFQCCRP